MATIQIFVGTVMGTALEVAKAAKAIFEANGDNVQLYEQFDPTEFDPKCAMLICTSNTGMGDLPENIVPFFNHLKTENPPVFETQYGLINLGDSSYPNFAQAGFTLDEALNDLGAIRVGEVFVMDATEIDNHEAEAAKWLESWRKQLIGPA